MQTTVIKLGGSILTDKKAYLSIRNDIIERLIFEIVQALKQNPQNLLLVLGAGGKAHKIVKKFRLLNNITSKNQKIKVIRVHLIVKELQKKIVGALLRKNLPAIPFQTNALFRYTKGGLTFTGKKIVWAALKNSLIPVLHGDFIFNEKQRLTVLSGDIISMVCAKNFSSRNIIFVSDIDGVFDRDPYAYSNARLYKNLDLKAARRIIKYYNKGEIKDATGQITGKLKAITAKLPKQKILIINGLKEGSLKEALINGKAGTVIK